MPRFTTQIREKVKQVLEADPDVIAAGFADIFSYYTNAVTNYPAISISIGRGDNDNDLNDETVDLTLLVQIFVKGVEDLESLLDTKAELVEPVLKNNRTLDGLVEVISQESFEYAMDIEKSVGVMFLNYNVKYEV